MSRQHDRRVGHRAEALDGIESVAGERHRADDPLCQVGTPDRPDEERVAGQDPQRVGFDTWSGPGHVNEDDLNDLIATIFLGTNPPEFDLNGDGSVNATDVAALVLLIP